MTSDYRRELTEIRQKQARESLNDARLLFEQGGSERSVINRLYYSLFYSAVALLQSKDLSSAKHSGVISLFDVHFTKSEQLPKWMSKFFHEIFDLRTETDYEVTQTPTRETVAELFSKPEKFIREIEGFLSNSER
ncbi:MAG: HEPN domain-containing protein [Candidatus Hydrogenedentota bacterium]|nr:MAG: HEPN domain-containing protein [Candidatus Hydrogenedentota bacterium]